MQRTWKDSLFIELREAQVIAEQARYGWKFDVGEALALLRQVSVSMNHIDSKLRPQLPNLVKQGNTYQQVFKKDGTLMQKHLNWVGEAVSGSYSLVDFEPMNLGSDQQVKDFLFTIGWKPTFWNIRKKDTKEGKAGERTSPKIRDNGNFCPNLLELDGDLANYIVEYLQLKHRKGLVEGLLKVVRPDGRISGEANTIGAATHRMTHKKIVNIPGCEAYLGTEIRKLFIAKEGYSILGCDSKSNQLRMLCHYMGDDEYTEAVINGDIHTLNQEKAGLPTRSQAKTFIYGFLFGAGDAKIGKIIQGTSADGKRLKDTFLRALPKLKRLVDSVRERVEKLGYVYGLDGRRIFVDSTHKALNYLLQGAEAVYMKYAQCFLWKWIKDEKLDAHYVATIHDEFQLEVLNAHIDRVKELALKAMLKAGEYLGITVPMEGDAKVGLSWADTH